MDRTGLKTDLLSGEIEPLPRSSEPSDHNVEPILVGGRDVGEEKIGIVEVLEVNDFAEKKVGFVNGTNEELGRVRASELYAEADGVGYGRFQSLPSIPFLASLHHDLIGATTASVAAYSLRGFTTLSLHVFSLPHRKTPRSSFPPLTKRFAFENTRPCTKIAMMKIPPEHMYVEYVTVACRMKIKEAKEDPCVVLRWLRQDSHANYFVKGGNEEVFSGWLCSSSGSSGYGGEMSGRGLQENWIGKVAGELVRRR
nr:hypothetical protein Iba_chr02dCG10440 [Ipomoea batatas]